MLAYIVAEMQYISLSESETDVKGAAYEELVGENLRGDRGEYFTPRNCAYISAIGGFLDYIASFFRF